MVNYESKTDKKIEEVAKKMLKEAIRKKDYVATEFKGVRLVVWEGCDIDYIVRSFKDRGGSDDVCDLASHSG